MDKQSPADALQLNAELRKVIEWLTVRLPKK